MTHHNVHSGLAPQMPGQLFRQEHGTMLSSGTAERDHEILESSALVSAHTRIDERHRAGEKLMHALLSIQVLDYRSVPPGQTSETFFPSWIGKCPAIEDKTP